MTSAIPAPNSIWRQLSTGLPMRVTPCVGDDGADEVAAHNCELAMHYRTMPLLSWRGCLLVFLDEFVPSNEPYPRLAG